jgi:ABC-type branched-subunit amino acid transport system ATPase component
VTALAAGPEPRQHEAGTATLEAIEVTKRFGGVQALRGVSLRLAQGEIVGLIGPNGSGKTTLLNCLSGVFAPTSGTITAAGRPLRGLPAHRIARLGVVRTFQNIRLFGALTALTNVEVGALGAGRIPRRRSREHALAMLRELGIEQLAHRWAGTLSYGDQRRLEIARALAGGPRFLLLDEPAAGMNEVESDALRQSIEEIRRERGCGILVVEHDLRLIMRLCERIYVLNEGTLISDGTPEEVRADPAVVAAYIGTEDRDTTNGGEA